MYNILSFSNRFLLSKCKIHSHVILLLALLLGTIGFLTLIDWPYLYSNDICSNNSDISLTQATSTSSSCTGISSLCSPLNMNINDSFHVYTTNSTDCTIINTSTIALYTLTNDAICQGLIESPSNYSLLNYNLVSGICVPDNYSNAVQMNNNTISVGLDFLVYASETQTQCVTHKKCYWNQDSIITNNYCSTCLSLCRLKNSLHFSQLCITIVALVLASQWGSQILYPIMSKMSPLRIQV